MERGRAIGVGDRGASNGGAREGRPRGRVHAYATISFDCIIAFRPGGIIRVNKLHIFSIPHLPFCAPGRAVAPAIVATFPPLIHDDCLIPWLIPLAPTHAGSVPGGSFWNNPSADAETGRKFTAVSPTCEVRSGGEGRTKDTAKFF